MLRFFSIVLGMILVPASTQCQVSGRFLLYGTKDGLSQNSVHAILRDKQGMIWIGTQDGLNNFDGKNFNTYRHSDEDSTTISDQFVVKLQEDKLNNIWIGTRNGLNSFNKHTQEFKRYYTDPQEKHSFQAAYFNFYVQQDNKVVVVKDQVFLLDPFANTLKQLKLSLPRNTRCFINEYYMACAIDEKNQLYFLPDLRKSEIIKLAVSPFSDKENLYSISAVPYKDSLMIFYCPGTSNRLIFFDIHKRSVEKIISLPVAATDIFLFSPDEIYVSHAKGLYKTGMSDIQEEPAIKTKMINDGLPPGPILTAYKDLEGNLWVGTSGNGIAVSNQSFANYELLKAPVQNDVINCITQSGKQFFVGTRSGIYSFNNNESNTLQNRFVPLYQNKTVTAIAYNNSRIWAGFQGEGLFSMDSKGRSLTKIVLRKTGPEGTILYLATTKKGQLLVCTTAGFFVVDDTGDLKNVQVKRYDLSGTYVMGVTQDSKGNIWVASNYGLDVFDSTFKPKHRFNSSDDSQSFIKRTIVTSVTEDLDGNIWIGTIRNGIYKYNNGQYEHYNTYSGLSSDVVYNVICDDNNRVWATTSSGLNIFNRNRKAFTTLALSDGVPNAAYLFGAAHKDGDRILLGTSEGLLICNTKNIRVHETSITALVADVKVNGRSIALHNNAFEIIADNKTVSFEISSVPAFFSGNIIYQYRLEGQHDNWITLPRGIHSISYNGLPYKKLVMQVRAAGAINSLNSATVFSIHINSKAPFWKTNTFIITAILFAVLLIGFILMLISKRNFRKQLQALKMEKELQGERVRIGRDLHDNIGAYTSALIAGLNRIRPYDQSQEKQVSDLKEYGTNIMSFLRETIWMLNTETLTVTAFADRFKNYALRIGKNYPEKDFRFTEAIEQDVTLSPTVMLNLFRILQEALQNACKHSEASLITVTIKNKNNLYFEIRDNGRGFREEQQVGHYGLDNMKQRAKEAGFELDIISGESGTTVSISGNTANAALTDTKEKI